MDELRAQPVVTPPGSAGMAAKGPQYIRPAFDSGLGAAGATTAPRPRQAVNRWGLPRIDRSIRSPGTPAHPWC